MMRQEGHTIYLIDGSAYMYRAYHAIRGLANSQGLPTNAVFGFTRMLIKLLEERSPQYAVVLLDAKGPTFRHELYQDYKANRPPMPDDLSIQIPLIKEVIEGMRIPFLELPGYEADDLIGTLARKAEAAGFRVVLVTGDKDFVQLITENTSIWDPMKEEVVDTKAVKQKYGVLPSQMLDVMGLSGDTIDNIPGVPGIGLKTALSLIQQFGSMDELYDRIDTLTKKKQKENLIQFKNQAALSRQLVTINTDISLAFQLDDARLGEPDSPKLAALFRRLEFQQLQTTFQEEGDLNRKQYQPVFNKDDLDNLCSRLQNADAFAIDTETTSEEPLKADLVGFSFAVIPDEAFYIPCAHEYPEAPAQLDLHEVLTQLKPVLEDASIQKIGQNVKYDMLVLDRYGIQLAGVEFDTMLASYLINPSKRSHSLDQIALDFLNHKTIRFEEVVDKEKASSGFAGVAIEKAVPYACEDADITLMASHVLRPRLEDSGLMSLFETVEMPLVAVLIEMEKQGIGVDKDKLKELSTTFAYRMASLENEIYSLAGEEFNIRSSQQLGSILFDKLKLPVQKKTKKKTGYSTDVNVLTTLAAHHPLPGLILEHRSLAKLKSTYADALINLIHPKTGRIHTSYNQTVTVTGRLSSSNPNLQNIPVRTEEGREIRRAFVPRRGWLLLSADYSQIELRILAHLSEDPILIQAFQEDEDIHARTATEVFQIESGGINGELRRQAKAINFGIIYGMSAYGLSQQLEISQKMAKVYIEHYFKRYQGVKAFIDRTIAEATRSKQTSTMLGRIRLLPEITSNNRNIRQFAERTAINTPIQGTAADFIKLAMIHVAKAMRKKALQSAMLLTVHDELVFEVPADELDIVKALVKENMEQVWPMRVPLKVNMAWGKNWAEVH